MDTRKHVFPLFKATIGLSPEAAAALFHHSEFCSSRQVMDSRNCLRTNGDTAAWATHTELC